jgi:hypothetical protein
MADDVAEEKKVSPITTQPDEEKSGKEDKTLAAKTD